MRGDWKEVADGVMAAIAGDKAAEHEALNRVTLRMVVCRDIFCRCGAVMDVKRAVMVSLNEARCSKDCGVTPRGWRLRHHKDIGDVLFRCKDNGEATYWHRISKVKVTCGTNASARRAGFSTWVVMRGRKHLGTFYSTLTKSDGGVGPDGRPLLDTAGLESILVRAVRGEVV